MYIWSIIILSTHVHIWAVFSALSFVHCYNCLVGSQNHICLYNWYPCTCTCTKLMVFFTEHSQCMFFMIPGSPSSPEIHRCSGTITIFWSELPELGALPFWVWAGWPPFQTNIRKKGKSKQDKFDMRLISHSYYGIRGT